MFAKRGVIEEFCKREKKKTVSDIKSGSKSSSEDYCLTAFNNALFF